MTARVKQWIGIGMVVVAALVLLYEASRWYPTIIVCVIAVIVLGLGALLVAEGMGGAETSSD